VKLVGRVVPVKLQEGWLDEEEYDLRHHRDIDCIPHSWRMRREAVALRIGTKYRTCGRTMAVSSARAVL